MSRIEFDREATEQQLQERVYELVIQYLETMEKTIGDDMDMPPEAMLRDARLMAIMLRIAEVCGLMEGLKGDTARALRAKSAEALRGCGAEAMLIRLLEHSVRFTGPEHADAGMLCAAWHMYAPEIVRRMKTEGMTDGEEVET